MSASACAAKILLCGQKLRALANLVIKFAKLLRKGKLSTGGDSLDALAKALDDAVKSANSAYDIAVKNSSAGPLS